VKQDAAGQVMPTQGSAQRAGRPDAGSERAGTIAAPIRVPRWAYPLVTIFSLLLGAAAIVRGTRAVQTITDSDLTNFFFKSADYILRGDPWHMYAVRASGAYPNYNPPLSIFLMAPLLSLARTLHFAANYGEQITFVSLPFTLFVPLLGWLVLRATRRLYPTMPETQRLLAFLLIVLSPLTWQSIATWYHLEQPMMLCLLVAALIALQARRPGLAGLLAGLALLSRTTALIPLIALGVLLLVGREWRTLLQLVVATGLVVGVGMAPFFLFDRADALYSFVSWRGTAAIGGNSIWSIFAYGGQTGLRHTLDALARRLDMPSVVVFVVIVAFLAARRLRVSAYSREAWAVLSIAALAVPMLSKTNWPYYYLEPFVLLLVWEFTSMHDRIAGVWRWPVLTFSFLVIASTLSQYIGLRSVGALDRISVGLLEFGSMLAFAFAIWLRMQAGKPAGAVAGSAAAVAPVGAGGLALGVPAGTPAGAAPLAPQPAWPASGPLPQQPTVPLSPASGPQGPRAPGLRPDRAGPSASPAPSPSDSGGFGAQGAPGWRQERAPFPPSPAQRPEPPAQRAAPQSGLPGAWPDLDASWPPRQQPRP
jgi:hypothetical protein